jgi:uncharacterized tellurite resistance protein B-like protein
MRSILSFLGVTTNRPSDSDAIYRIAAELDRLEPERARYLAAFAFVLSRVAHADHDVTADETATMERLIIERGSVPQAEAVLIVEMAKQQQRLFGGTDDFLVTRELAQIATAEQKRGIVDCLFAVASADRRLLAPEADEIARIARELRVDQADLSKIRTGYAHLIAAREGLSS